MVTPGEILARRLKGKAEEGDEELFVKESRKALGPACASFKVTKVESSKVTNISQAPEETVL